MEAMYTTGRGSFDIEREKMAEARELVNLWYIDIGGVSTGYDLVHILENWYTGGADVAVEYDSELGILGISINDFHKAEGRYVHLLAAIAPCVERGSWIEFVHTKEIDEPAFFRFYFNGHSMLTQDARIVYDCDDEDEDDTDDEEEDGNYEAE